MQECSRPSRLAEISSVAESGGRDRIRTRDFSRVKGALYQLSYAPAVRDDCFAFSATRRQESRIAGILSHWAVRRGNADILV